MQNMLYELTISLLIKKTKRKLILMTSTKSRDKRATKNIVTPGNQMYTKKSSITWYQITIIEIC